MGKKRKKEKKDARKERSPAPIVEELRSAAEPMIRLAGSPMVAELVASALIAGAGALARSPVATQAAAGPEVSADGLNESATQSGRPNSDLASLVAYSVAIAAGEIVGRLAAAYEGRVGGGKVAEQVATAARQAAHSAWDAFGTDRH